MVDRSPPLSLDQEAASLPALLPVMGSELRPVLVREAARDVQRPTSADTTPYLAFLLAGRELVLPLADVQETGRLVAVAPLPNLPRWIYGIMHIRGEILPVVDLACLLELSAAPRTGPGKPYLFFRRPDLACCLAVERASTIVRPDDQEFLGTAAEPPLHLELAGQPHEVLRSTGREILLLDSERLDSVLRFRNWRNALDGRLEIDAPCGDTD
ncbi:MAG: chemotaxis protein CheW [Desulfobulbus sp.]|jgi:purine-binding chemotaxis protein CheW|nr:chemotaxis protein CheW [Desulfobulbus sp.]